MSDDEIFFTDELKLFEYLKKNNVFCKKIQKNLQKNLVYSKNGINFADRKKNEFVKNFVRKKEYRV